jgi:hypothetical protein
MTRSIIVQNLKSLAQLNHIAKTFNVLRLYSVKKGSSGYNLKKPKSNRFPEKLQFFIQLSRFASYQNEFIAYVL